jgi:uncharacterized protein (TIGR00725 family)
MTTIAVIGAGDAAGDDYVAAVEIGRRLADAGATVVCGGLAGVMEGACRGARLAGGHSIGILPGSDRRDANPYVDVVIATGLGEARNLLVVRSADAVIAVGGAFGTLSEIGFALKLGIPVVGLRTWELGRGGEPAEVLTRVDNPATAVKQALALAGGDT